MLLYELTENVIDFPTHLAKRSQLMKRLKKASSRDAGFLDAVANSGPERTGGFYIVDPNKYDAPIDGKSYSTYEEAEKAIPAVQMKTGKRGLVVQ